MSAPVLPPPTTDTVEVTVRLPRRLVERVEAIGRHSGHKRHRVLLNFIQWAVEAYEKEHGL